MTDPVPLTADPTRWDHAEACEVCDDEDCRVCPGLTSCSCGLSALREAVASGDPLAVLDVLGMGGTVVPTSGWQTEIASDGLPSMFVRDDLYRVVRPLPDAPEVSP